MAEPNRLNLDDLAPADRELVFGGKTYPIRGRLPVEREEGTGYPGLIDLLRLETRINNASANVGEEDFGDVLSAAIEDVMAIVREKTPDVERFRMDEVQLLAVLGWLAGGDTVAEAVTELLSAGQPGEEDAPSPEPRTAEEVEEEGKTPLASTISSPSPSSGSDDTTAGRPATGEPEDSTPDSSEHTSETLTAVSPI